MRTIEVPPSATPAQILGEAFDLQERIREATDLINAWQERLGRLKEEALVNGIKEAGNFELIEKQRVTRKVNVERFRERFPAEYARIREIEIARFMETAGKNVLLKDAEQLLGKLAIDPVCDLQTSISFVVAKRRVLG